MANSKKKTTKVAPSLKKVNQGKSGIYGIDASKSSVNVVHGSELTGIVK